MQLDRVARIPAVVALKVIASPLKSRRLMAAEPLPEPESAEKKCHGHHPVQQFVATAGVVGKMMIGNVSIRV